MAQEIINVGTAPNDGAGDPLRTAFTKTNNNFSQLFAAGGISGISNGTSNITVEQNAQILISATGIANVVAIAATGMTVTGTLIGNSTISATGNVIAGQFFIGNGSQLTGIVSSAPAALLTGNTLSSNVVNSSLTSVGTLGSLDVTANVQAGNLRTSGQVSASGNIAGANFNAGTDVSATGNIAGNFFIGNGSQLTGITSSYGNTNVVANLAALDTNPVSTSGNITGGNITGGNITTGGVGTFNGSYIVIPTGTVDPAVTISGAFYYNTANLNMRVYADGAWRNA